MKLRTRTNQPVEGDEIENLEVSGNLKAFENIVDKDGHKRFIEDVGEAGSIAGVTPKYCRYSLSGSHLLLVYCSEVANGTTINAGINLASFKLPKWISDKIYPVFDVNGIEVKQISWRSDDWSQQTDTAVLTKSNDILYIHHVSSFTATAKRNCRIQFDLLIDNESGE